MGKSFLSAMKTKQKNQWITFGFFAFILLIWFTLLPSIRKAVVNTELSAIRSSNLSALTQANQAAQELNMDGDISQFKNKISSMDVDIYSKWQQMLFLTLTQKMEKFTEETKINKDLFSDPKLLSTKTYLSQKVASQKKCLSNLHSRDLHADIQHMVREIHEQSYEKCITTYTTDVCNGLKAGVLSGIQVKKLQMALVARRDYLDQELVLAELILKHYKDFDKNSVTPRFKTPSLQKQLVLEAQKIIDLSNKLTSLQQEAMSNAQQSVDDLNRKYN